MNIGQAIVDACTSWTMYTGALVGLAIVVGIGIVPKPSTANDVIGGLVSSLIGAFVGTVGFNLVVQYFVG